MVFLGRSNPFFAARVPLTKKNFAGTGVGQREMARSKVSGI
jgi:hypothetical protein